VHCTVLKKTRVHCKYQCIDLYGYIRLQFLARLPPTSEISVSRRLRGIYILYPCCKERS